MSSPGGTIWLSNDYREVIIKDTMGYVLLLDKAQTVYKLGDTERALKEGLEQIDRQDIVNELIMLNVI